MNSGPLIFLGLFVAMACSWLSFVLGPQMQIGDLGQTNTVAFAGALPQTYPLAHSGEARQGAEVYRANGCAACHTQMVRSKDLGSDLRRGWGARRSVADDYIFEQPPMLGDLRVGPDLANFGRRTYFKQILLRLYDPRLVAPGTIMPSYRFLFDTRKIGLQPAPDALELPAGAAPPDMEVIPTPRALALASYLMSLRQDGYLFVAPPPPPPPTNKVVLATPPVTK